MPRPLAQGENNCGGDGTPGNSLLGIGYGCSLSALIRGYRALWSAVSGTTDPLVPFGVVTLAAGGSEGSGQHMAGIRWSQTANNGVLPSPLLPRTFLAQAFDIGDPWLTAIDNDDAHHCARPDTTTGAYGPTCVRPWTNESAWDDDLRTLAPRVRNDSTPEFLGSIHARIKSPVGRRLAHAYLALIGKTTGALSGPTIAGCEVADDNSSIAVTYNASLLRGEVVQVTPFNNDVSTWGTGGDSLTFMVCVITAKYTASDCVTELALWSPVPAIPGTEGGAVTLSLTPAQISAAASGSLVAVRYAWPLGDRGDTCCPSSNVTNGLQVCAPGSCPIKTATSLLPGNPFYAMLVSRRCACNAPQLCDG